MKYLIFLAAIFSAFSLNAFAGGGGGTVLPGAMVAWDSQEIVRHIDELNGEIYFQYGSKVDGKWVIENLIIPKGELKLDGPAFEAIQNSKLNGNWWGIPEL